MSCQRNDVRSIIDRMFLKGLKPREWRSMREHLYACQGCCAYYDRITILHQRVHQDTAPLSPGQLDLLGDNILDRLSPRRHIDWAWPKRWTPYLGAVMALGLMLFFVVPDQGLEFQARGLSANPGVGVRAMCVASEPSGEQWVRAIFPQSKESQPRSFCKLSDVLTFSYSNAVGDGASGYSYLFLLGVDADWRPLWYYPRPRDGASIAIEMGIQAVDRPLPGGIKLAINHKPGEVRVYGLFTDEPLSVQQVEDRFDDLRQGSLPPTAIDEIGIAVGARVSFSMSLVE